MVESLIIGIVALIVGGRLLFSVTFWIIAIVIAAIGGIFIVAVMTVI